MNTDSRTLQTARNAWVTPTVRASIVTAHAPCSPNKNRLVLFRGEGDVVRMERCVSHSHVVYVKGEDSTMINCTNTHVEFIGVSMHVAPWTSVCVLREDIPSVFHYRFSSEESLHFSVGVHHY
jgi:hypothetical protein